MLPARIIYTVWSGDRSGWTDTRDAIARNLVQLGDDWRLHYVPDFGHYKAGALSGYSAGLTFIRHSSYI